MQTARQQSWRFVTSAGLPMNDNLPLVEGTLRPISALVDRTLCLNVLAAVSFGFAVPDAKKWLEEEDLLSSLSPREGEFLERKSRHQQWFEKYPEALFALSWRLGVAQSLSPDQNCPSDLLTLFPNLKKRQESRAFREAVRLVPEQQALAILDLYYCTHWAARETGRFDRFPGLELRRYALE